MLHNFQKLLYNKKTGCQRRQVGYGFKRNILISKKPSAFTIADGLLLQNCNLVLLLSREY